MQQSKFAKLLERSETDLVKIRSKYFPLIEDGIITGYNIYPVPIEPQKGPYLSYLHAYLKSKDKHFVELHKALRQEGLDLEEKIKVSSNLVERSRTLEREADYITEASWEDPPTTRYFLFDCTELPRKGAVRLKEKKRSVVGEDFQYDLEIKITSIPELRRIVDIFKEYASKHKLDESGRRLMVEREEEVSYKENKEAISDAWEILSLIYTPVGRLVLPEEFTDFVPITQFNIAELLNREPITLCTLVGNKVPEFRRSLNEKGIKLKAERKYILRVFRDDYIDKS